MPSTEKKRSTPPSPDAPHMADKPAADLALDCETLKDLEPHDVRGGSPPPTNSRYAAC